MEISRNLYHKGCTACLAAAIVNGDVERVRLLMRIPRVRYADKCWVAGTSLPPARALDPAREAGHTSNPSRTSSFLSSSFSAISKNSELHFSCTPILIGFDRDTGRNSSNKNLVYGKYSGMSVTDLALCSPGQEIFRILMESENLELSDGL